MMFDFTCVRVCGDWREKYFAFFTSIKKLITISCCMLKSFQSDKCGDNRVRPSGYTHLNILLIKVFSLASFSRNHRSSSRFVYDVCNTIHPQLDRTCTLQATYRVAVDARMSPTHPFSAQHMNIETCKHDK
jgi:hypothetical protein